MVPSYEPGLSTLLPIYAWASECTAGRRRYATCQGPGWLSLPSQREPPSLPHLCGNYDLHIRIVAAQLQTEWTGTVQHSPLLPVLGKCRRQSDQPLCRTRNRTGHIWTASGGLGPFAGAGGCPPPHRPRRAGMWGRMTAFQVAAHPAGRTRSMLGWRRMPACTLFKSGIDDWSLGCGRPSEICMLRTAAR